MLVTQGVFQGECLSTAVFCIFLRAIVDQFYTDLGTIKLPQNLRAPPRELVTILAYVDDVVISCHPALFDFVWPLWLKVLSDHGLQVEPSKCKAWIPEETTKSLNIDSQVPAVLGGLPVLGTAAQSNHSCLIIRPTSDTPSLTLLADAHKRLQQAQDDAILLEQMAQTSTFCPCQVRGMAHAYKISRLTA